MKFIGDNYGFLWRDGQVETIYIECTKHSAASEIGSLHNFRSEEMKKLSDVPLAVKINRSDPEVSLSEMNFQKIGHEWIRYELGEFSQPPDQPETVWMTFFGDILNVDLELSSPAFNNLHQELRAFGRSTDPKCFWGLVLGDFFLSHGTKLIDGSDKQRTAFFSKGLSVFSTGSVPILFAVGSDHPDELSWSF